MYKINNIHVKKKEQKALETREYLTNCPVSERKMISRLVWMSFKVKNIYMSQEYLALEVADITRSQANRNLQRMNRELPIFTMRNRGIKKTCSYHIDPLIKDASFASYFYDLFPFLYDLLRIHLLLLVLTSQSLDRTRVLRKEEIITYEESFMEKLPVYLQALSSYFTQQQLFELLTYPESAIKYAAAVLEKKSAEEKITSPFAFFKVIAKQHSLKQQSYTGARRKTGSSRHEPSNASASHSDTGSAHCPQQEYDTAHIRRERPVEDPFQAVQRIAQNLTETTEHPRYGTITPAMKLKAAQPDPWWSMLDDTQKRMILDEYPVYALVIGKQSHGLFKAIHDRNLEHFKEQEFVRDTQPPVVFHESPVTIEQFDEVPMTDNSDDYVNYNEEFYTVFGER